MDALLVIPRRNNVSDAARAWALARTLGSGFVAPFFHCAANIGRAQMPPDRR